MAEKETVFTSTVTYTGVFIFKEYYKFCYNWLMEDFGMDEIIENKYKEKIVGDAKEIEIKWLCKKDVTDYFRYEVKVNFTGRGLKKVEVSEGNAKIEADKGEIKVSVDGALVMDYKGKFETSPFNKFLRDIYQRWVITPRVDSFKKKLMAECDEFLLQAKAYLDLEGKRQ